MHLHGGGAVRQLAKHGILAVVFNPQINAGQIGGQCVLQPLHVLELPKQLKPGGGQAGHARLLQQRFLRAAGYALAIRSLPGRAEAVPIRAEHVGLHGQRPVLHLRVRRAGGRLAVHEGHIGAVLRRFSRGRAHIDIVHIQHDGLQGGRGLRALLGRQLNGQRAAEAAARPKLLQQLPGYGVILRVRLHGCGGRGEAQQANQRQHQGKEPFHAQTSFVIGFQAASKTLRNPPGTCYRSAAPCPPEAAWRARAAALPPDSAPFQPSAFPAARRLPRPDR